MGLPTTKVLQRGFTLFEVLVALAIIAIALSSVGRVATMAIDNTTELRDRQLAYWVADNRVAWHRATLSWPGLGTASGEEVQGGRGFVWSENVTATPNPAIRRLDVEVALATDEARRSLVQVSAFLGSE